MCGECDWKISDEELEKYRIRNIGRNDFETGLSRDERFLINKMHSKYIEKLQKDLEDVR
jgi:hypothetical protein